VTPNQTFSKFNFYLVFPNFSVLSAFIRIEEKLFLPVKIQRWGVGVVFCLEQGVDYLHMVHLMPLHPQAPLFLASFKSRLVLLFGNRLTQVILEKRPLNG